MGAFAIAFAKYLPLVIQAGGDIVEAMEWGTEKVRSFQANDPTDTDWAELNARMDTLTAALNQDPPAA